ncbi:hypothetical protein [Halalkalicoccus jeotgali]|nr:hypothetical protein [Halalkalicoccus jeotgali]
MGDTLRSSVRAEYGADDAPVVSSSEGTAILGANERSEFAPVV